MGSWLGAKKAREYGKSFEQIVDKYAMMQGILSVPHKQKVFTKSGFVPVKQPFDRTLAYQGIAVFLDLKTFQGDEITKKLIDEDQVESLIPLQERGFAAGYLIWFRKSNAVCFCWASELSEVLYGFKKSIHGKDMIWLGSLEDLPLGRLFSLQWER